MEFAKYNMLWTPNDFIVNSPPSFTKNDFMKINLISSEIEECIIKDCCDNIVSNNNKNYAVILYDIYCKLKINGMTPWYKECNLNIIMNKIINMVESNKYSIYIRISTTDNGVIEYGYY